jgi:hypothetical protein
MWKLTLVYLIYKVLKQNRANKLRKFVGVLKNKNSSTYGGIFTNVCCFLNTLGNLSACFIPYCNWHFPGRVTQYTFTFKFKGGTTMYNISFIREISPLNLTRFLLNNFE